MEPEGAWRKTEKTAPLKEHEADTALPETYRQRIEEKISVANDAYKAFSTILTGVRTTRNRRRTGAVRAAATACGANSPGQWKQGDRLSESTEALAQELENVLLGSGFGVKYNDGVMEIQRRVIK